MKILVTFAEVAAVADNFEIEDGAVADRYLEYDLNEWDEYALEAAVSLREEGIAEEVVTVTIGPERSADTIRMALAKGADRAIRIWDDDLRGDPLEDVSTRAALMAPVVEAEAPTLVLSGVQAADDGYGSTGVSLARTLGWQWGAVVNDFTLDREADSVRVRRELEGGIEEITTLSLPAVLTIQTGINDPRYASLRGLQEAQAQEIDVQSPAELGVWADRLEPRLERGELTEPPSRGDTEYVEGDPPEQATAIADRLLEAGVVQE
ncbi:electron transfer flavoprotein subunit beta/FixA family protein [Halodesulfurarchaeum sp. HSR-GB]|uniref:electron transfer flavoprotein subunit beta/FixA family protein n=1 Tax=Halodesulfurarchaeum sp. HSR-GB TaxID=3074077 RepID=UPI00286175EF|nr:electron transfer flavoprotein subunit beta/FixA family protein [Halodesulfurarchaeum sp. HSR-GB]MDR5656403.1 electron transfer flavoprotein subunit beta/FixA family protein [Halodesulfurarchaeum sp. HSR-GB]